MIGSVVSDVENRMTVGGRRKLVRNEEVIIPFPMVKRVVDVSVVVVVVVDKRIAAGQVELGDKIGPMSVKGRITFELSVKITTDDCTMQWIIRHYFF